MKVTQLAINSVSTRQQTLEEALDAYAAAGFQKVEFKLNQLKDWLAQGHTIAEARALLGRRGFRCIGGFEAQVECFTSPDAQRANHDRHRENAALIHALGGGILVVGTDGPPERSPETLATIARVLARLVATLERFDVVIALEFNWSPVVKSLQSAVRIVEQVQHPQLGVLFDAAHYYTTPTKSEHLTPDTVRWIKHVHLNDMRDKPADFSNCNTDRVLPGQGILDLPALISTLEQHGYSSWYSIEMFNETLWQMSADEAARACFQSLLPLCD
ncbi:MAG: sugar phosphate isomerase/epimerase [Chloroflexi bacterium]|nr:sugar phosphate isomerase/epimerase [Chloroflexota bacterium]